MTKETRPALIIAVAVVAAAFLVVGGTMFHGYQETQHEINVARDRACEPYWDSISWRVAPGCDTDMFDFYDD